jgi:hypothetical protein
VLNLGVPAAEPTDATIQRQIDSKKRFGNIGPHSLRLIARKQLGFRNLFFGSVANLHYSGAKGFLRIPMAG